MDQMRSGSASLQPDVEATVGVALIHFAEDSAVGVAGIRLDPAAVAERLIPLGRLHAFHIHKSIAFHAESPANFPGDTLAATLPFGLVLFVNQIGCLAVVKFIQRQVRE